MFGRVGMHENGSETRTLRLTPKLDPNEAAGREWEEVGCGDEGGSASADAAAAAAAAAEGRKLWYSLPLPMGRAAAALPHGIAAGSVPTPRHALAPPDHGATGGTHRQGLKRVLLPSEVLASGRAALCSEGEECLGHHAAPNGLVVYQPTQPEAESDTGGAISCFALELQLHGVSVALVDNVPRELVQLNLRTIRLGVVATPIMSRTTFRLRSLTVDNLLPNSFNPLLLQSDAAPASSATNTAGGHSANTAGGHSGGPPSEAVSLTVVKRVHPTHSAYRHVELELVRAHCNGVVLVVCVGGGVLFSIGVCV